MRQAGSSGSVAVISVAFGAGHRRSLLLSSALVALACASAGVQPASAQAVTGSGSVTPIPIGGFPTLDWALSGDLIVGNGGTGTLSIGADGTVTSTTGYIGYNVASNGTVTVSGAGAQWTNTGDLAVGTSGTGTLSIGAGGTVTNINSYVGLNLGSVGSVTVSGAGAKWENAGYLNVGFLGAGTLTIADGGKVSSLGVSIGDGAAGTINIGAASTNPADAVGAGILSASMLTFGEGIGTLNFNHTGTDYVFSTALASTTSGHGSHAVNHYAGTTTLTGDSSAFAGDTTVYGGTLLVGENGKLGGRVFVNAGGTFGGTGTVGDTEVDGGTLNANGLTIDGDLVVAVGSTVVLGGDMAVVTGGAIITPGAVAHIQANGHYDLGATYTILSAIGGVFGTFDTVTTDFAFLTPSLDYSVTGQIDLTLSRNTAAFASLASTPNQIAVANSLDSIGIAASNPVYDAIAQLPDDADLVQASFAALSGDIQASAQTTLINTATQTGVAANERIRAAFGGIDTAASPVLAYGPGGPNLAASTPDGMTAWGGAFGSWGRLDGDGNATAIDTRTGGLLLGADSLVGDWRLGLMAGYGQSGFDSANGIASGSSDDYTLGLYGGTQWGNLAFRTGLAYGWHDLDTTRSVALLGETLHANYGAGAVQGFGEVSYRLDTAIAAFEPFVNLAHVRLDTDGFSETGGAAALTSSASTSHTSFTTLGLRASGKFALGTTLATAHATLGWRHAFGDTPSVTQAFSAGDAFTVAGTPIAADTALLAAGLDLDLSATASLGFSYTGQIAGKTQDHGIAATLGMTF